LLNVVCKASGESQWLRIWALVHKVKFGHLWLALHVADLAGIRNLKKMGKVEFQVVTRLLSVNHGEADRVKAPHVQAGLASGQFGVLFDSRFLDPTGYG
jgi:hypothetical protein